jgi:hypothetical protein
MHANTHMERGSPTDRFIQNLRDDSAISYIALYQDSSIQSSQCMQVLNLLFFRSEASLCLLSTSQGITFLGFFTLSLGFPTPGEVEESCDDLTVSAEAAAEMWSARRQWNLPSDISVLCIHGTPQLTHLCFLFFNLCSDLGQKMLALVMWVTSKELAQFRKFSEATPSFIYIILFS